MRQLLLRPIAIISILGLVLLGFAAGGVGAQEDDPGNGLRISPVRQELTLAPGQDESYEIEITNVSGGPLSVSSLVNDFESDDESGQPRILTGIGESSPFGLSNFITLPGLFDLEPGQSQTVTIGVRVAGDAAPGGYFGLVRFASGLSDENPGNVTLSASVGSILLVNVSGEVQEGMSLNFIEPRKDGDSGRFFESSPDGVAVSLNNIGNSILKPFGRVTIKNLFGSEVASYELNSGDQLRANVLPRSSRTFEDSVSNLGRIGRYTIETNISYGEGGGNIISGETTFWIVPWKLILVATVIIVGGAWTATSGIKIYNRRVINRSKKQ